MRQPLVLAAVLVACVRAAAAQQAANPAATVERAVVPNGSGPRKLQADPELLGGASATAPGQRHDRLPSVEERLADFRLVDRRGGEVPYLLLSPPTPREVWLAGALLATPRAAKHSGFEVDLGRAALVDAMAVEGLSPPYMKRLRLEGSGDRARWTVLAAQATLFDLPRDRVRQTAVEFRPGSYRYLRLTWDDASSAILPLPGRVTAREARSSAVPAPQRAAVPIVRQVSEPGRSRYRMALPAPALPVVAIVLYAGSGDVFRTAVVTEPRFNGTRADPVELGRSRLVRSSTSAAAVTALRLAIEAPQGRELELVIDDGNNPPLEIGRAEIELAALPWIYFESTGEPLTARYGGAAERRPQYDLEAKRSAVRLDTVPLAAWGDARRVSEAGMTPAALPARGAWIDTAGFPYQRPLTEGSAALVALPIDPAILAHSRGPGGGFADVRIVDDAGNQIPYLLERRDGKVTIELAARPATPPAPEPGVRAQSARSFYTIVLPYANLPDASLILDTSDRVFRRPIQLGVQRPPDRRRRDAWFEVHADAVWQHADAGTAASPLELAIRPDAPGELLLVVDEGDNRPLPVTAVRLLLPSWRLRFFRPAGRLRVVYGRRDLAPPQYDLALLAPAVLGADVREIAAAPETAAAPPPALVSPRIFWIGLGLAVIVLLALIVRLVASGTAPAPPG